MSSLVCFLSAPPHVIACSDAYLGNYRLYVSYAGIRKLIFVHIKRVQSDCFIVQGTKQ